MTQVVESERQGLHLSSYNLAGPIHLSDTAAVSAIGRHIDNAPHCLPTTCLRTSPLDSALMTSRRVRADNSKGDMTSRTTTRHSLGAQWNTHYYTKIDTTTTDNTDLHHGALDTTQSTRATHTTTLGAIVVQTTAGMSNCPRRSTIIIGGRTVVFRSWETVKRRMSGVIETNIRIVQMERGSVVRACFESFVCQWPQGLTPFKDVPQHKPARTKSDGYSHPRRPPIPATQSAPSVLPDPPGGSARNRLRETSEPAVPIHAASSQKHGKVKAVEFVGSDEDEDSEIGAPNVVARGIFVLPDQQQKSGKIGRAQPPNLVPNECVFTGNEESAFAALLMDLRTYE